MQTFYVSPSQISNNVATITGSEYHHLRNVLRTRPGEVVRIIDGKGNVYTAQILETHNARISSEVRILSHEFHAIVSPKLTLFQGLPKNDKMELILQKTTELGVTQIVPLHSEYALQKPSQNRYARWHRVLIAATKQSERAWLPELGNAQVFETALAQLDTFSRCLFFSPHRDQKSQVRHIQTVLRETPCPTSIALFVGPEGGFSDQEVTRAIESGCTLVTLGRNILRTETAAIVAVAITAYEYQL
ncbi:16S rRNA (uracil(1498)-N(3))-methyltransferase [Candidatus Poribacteria bacterium]|nr:16S rRNA (uracil(1498)-N(3))-methyltransferase [Candidatus Poribacteria bacterium]MYA54820.1 16S rRNA (uracil(1498)-N(3))-methyltransferase [Candidatus Poribacteria bacterium]